MKNVLTRPSLAVVLRTADCSRVADVELPGTTTAQQLIDMCTLRWQLPTDRDYVLYCERRSLQLDLKRPLTSQEVQAGDELVLDALLQAGADALDQAGAYAERKRVAEASSGTGPDRNSRPGTMGGRRQ